jgi:chaperonin GroES
MTKTQELITKTPLKPLGNRVLLARLKAEETLKGGIILPDTAKKKQEQAIVIALGTGKKEKNGTPIPFSVKENDRVLIDKYAGQEVTINNETFIIARDEDLIAIIEA